MPSDERAKRSRFGWNLATFLDQPIDGEQRHDREREERLQSSAAHRPRAPNRDALPLRQGWNWKGVAYPSSPSATRSRSTPASAKVARKRRTRSNSRSFRS